MRTKLPTTKKVLCNKWKKAANNGEPGISRILGRNEGIEGIDFTRYRFRAGDQLRLENNDGHLFSVQSGRVLLQSNLESNDLSLVAGTHTYIPPNSNSRLKFTEDGMAIHAAANAGQSRGQILLVHDERFLASSRFVLTPQYLSRRAFLHRDETLLSSTGNPVAWFHTTMFDTQGLPLNNEGIEVFKMSYNYQSEVNVIYKAEGAARVRFAIHPYTTAQSQDWTTWERLGDDTTYCLNEGGDGPEVEHYIDSDGKITGSLRNRHEVFIEPGGHLSLCCLFDPAPTGLEIHEPGEYSSYCAVESILATQEYQEFLEDVAVTDEMIRELSLLAARNDSRGVVSSPYWRTYQNSLATARKIQDDLIAGIAEARKDIVRPWRLTEFTADDLYS